MRYAWGSWGTWCGVGSGLVIQVWERDVSATDGVLPDLKGVSEAAGKRERGGVSWLIHLCGTHCGNRQGIAGGVHWVAARLPGW